ncbi:MAG: hypothetical protein ABI330_18350 [Caldimonas sp.]
MNHEKSSLVRRTPVRAGAVAIGAAAAIGTVVALANWHARAADGSAGLTLLAQVPSITVEIRKETDPNETARATVPSAADVIDRAPESGEPSPSF